MTTTVRGYLDEVEQVFLLPLWCTSCCTRRQVREREERLYEGFIRLRAVLSNGDLLEAFEFVVATPDALQTLTYRIHWQQGDGRLSGDGTMLHIIRKYLLFHITCTLASMTMWSRLSR